MSSTTRSKSKSKQTDTQYVGYYYSGFLKQGTAKFFMAMTEEELDQKYEDHKKYYGEFYICKYIVCENAEKVYTKLKEKLQNKHQKDDIYLIHTQAAIDELKSISGVNKCKIKQTKPIKIETTDDKPKKSSKKTTSSKEKDESSGVDEKPKKSSKKPASSKEEKDESSDDEKPKKNQKKNKSKNDTDEKDESELEKHDSEHEKNDTCSSPESDGEKKSAPKKSKK